MGRVRQEAGPLPVALFRRVCANTEVNQTMPWRTRRDQDASLEMWEVLAEEFEKSGQDLPADFDKAAEAARKSKEDFDKAAEAVRKAEAEAARKATAEAARTGQGRKAQAEAAQKARAEAGQKAQEDLNAAWNTAKRNVEKELAGYFHQHPRTALCFSGGGVRSATFGLGVLHGLARAKLGANRESPVPEFDFLSTVSGGGYVGGWFSAWAARKDSTVASAVEELARPEPAATLDPDPGPLLHIRRYCAFLNPKLGALSADTWTLAATMLRNMLLNWQVLIPMLMVVLLLMKLL